MQINLLFYFLILKAVFQVLHTPVFAFRLRFAFRGPRRNVLLAQVENLFFAFLPNLLCATYFICSCSSDYVILTKCTRRFQQHLLTDSYAGSQPDLTPHLQTYALLGLYCNITNTDIGFARHDLEVFLNDVIKESALIIASLIIQTSDSLFTVLIIFYSFF